MKSTMLIFILTLSSLLVSAQDPYYYGEGKQFNPNIPTPEAFFGFQIGSSLVRYDKVVEYFKLLADKSDRVSFEVFGKTWQQRDQVKLIVTAPENQQQLESIRKEHLKLVDPTASVDYASQKIIVELAYNVHGGEIAGTDASVLAAYYLAASEDPAIIARLKDAVVLIEPSQNPDGRERAVNYINGFASSPAIADPADLGHAGGWTPHRGNHFWNDLNRDWLALSQVESQNRVAYYHRWYPNVYLDFHEMGSGSTYYFEPSPLGSWNKILPQSNYTVLTAILADHFAAALNNIGSLYFTKESFTNLSPIYGSTYPDYQGGAGITLEVGSTSGVEVETEAGIRKFSRNLKENFEVSMAGLKAATEKRETFLKEQKNFFESALSQADKLPTKTIVFGDHSDDNLNRRFLEHLLNHHIEVYSLTKNVTLEGKTFEAGKAYVVPLKQAQFRILQSIFEENETNGFDKKNVFYDVSGWSTVHGYGIPFVKSKTQINAGSQVLQLPAIVPAALDQATLAYAFDYQDLLAPKAVYFLQEKGILPRVAHQDFTSKTTKGEVAFTAGSIIVPLAYQSLPANEVYAALQELSNSIGIAVHAITDGFSVKGIDLGSNNVKVLKKPTVALVSGGNWTSFGEVWALLSQTYGLPVVKLDGENSSRFDLSRYTRIILTGDKYDAEFGTRLAQWVENGGTLISLNTSNAWVNKFVFADRKTTTALNKENPAVKASSAPTAGREGRLTGVIVKAELNAKSPLSFGLSNKAIYALKTNAAGIDSLTAETIVLKSSDVLINGFVDTSATAKLKPSIVVASASKGKGGVVYFSESPTFRGYWLSTSRLLVNAIFFGANNGLRRF